MKVYLIRHGQTTGDIEGRYGGTYDDHLTEKGRAQMRETAFKLVGSEIEALFSSPLMRAQEGAQIISRALGAPMEIVPEFRERHYGILTGLTKEDAKQKYPEAVEQHENYLNTDPEGERYEDFCNRVMNAFQMIRKQNYKTVGIITHGGPIKCILRELGMAIPDKIEDGAIIELGMQK